MKILSTLILLLISSNAFSENFDFTAFARELEELELNKETSKPLYHVDEINKTQAGQLRIRRADAVEMDEVYKITPLPGLEIQEETILEKKEANKPKRIRSK